MWESNSIFLKKDFGGWFFFFFFFLEFRSLIHLVQEVAEFRNIKFFRISIKQILLVENPYCINPFFYIWYNYIPIFNMYLAKNWKIIESIPSIQKCPIFNIQYVFVFSFLFLFFLCLFVWIFVISFIDKLNQAKTLVFKIATDVATLHLKWAWTLM